MMPEEEERLQWFRAEVLPLEPLLRRRAARFRVEGADEPVDLVHDTFVAMMSFAGWRGVENTRAFALTTLRNRALQLMARRKVVPLDMAADLQQLDLPDDRPGAERHVEARDEIRLLWQVIGELPPQCRKVFTLSRLFGLSHRDIAARLGLSKFTVDKHVTKGLRICTERLALHPAPPARAADPNTPRAACRTSD